jgi:hypothetical protein
MLSTHSFHNNSYHKNWHNPFSMTPIHAILSKGAILSKWPLFSYILSQWVLSTQALLPALCSFFSPSTQRMLTRIEMKLVAQQTTVRKFVLKQYFSFAFSGTIARKLLLYKLENEFLICLIVHDMHETAKRNKFLNNHVNPFLRLSCSGSIIV